MGKKRGVGDGGGADRLSELPEDVFLKILSCVDAITKFRTCSVSKQWIKLRPSLDTKDLCIEGTYIDNFYRYFHHFMSHHQHVVKIGKFRVASTDDGCGSRLCEIIDFAMDRYVDCLVLNLETWYSPELTPRLSVPRCLKTLHLRSVTVPREGYLPPTLTGMALVNCPIYMVPYLSCSCPNLKELWLMDCQFRRNSSCIRELGPKLTKLTIECTKFGAANTKISAPNLKSFSLLRHSMHDLPLVDFPSLEYAEVDALDIDQHLPNPLVDIPSLEYAELDASSSSLDTDQHLPNQVYISLINLLEGLHNAKFVSLSSTVIQVLSMFLDELLYCRPCPFIRLKTLKLRMNAEEGSSIPAKVMIYFLKSSPSLPPPTLDFDQPIERGSLETLHFDCGIIHNREDSSESMLRDDKGYPYWPRF
ncbi:hypothetical protein Tsubulata_027051 [Turnera subulata]|uniref:F-box domain-containing protein n=1 Tax=Turnera subulata TaxID=218843 RepID=A0A9Q0JAW2_9ROSI|nr:hypothetical protein Tsubulata_027051 [Turnera subulata]